MLQQNGTTLIKLDPNQQVRKLAVALPVDTLTWITGVIGPRN
jgi:hypothetical protein